MNSSVNKRVFDVLFSLIFVLATSWLVILIVLLYTLTLQFPLFFIQERTGKDGVPFRLFKFRSLNPGLLPLNSRRFWLGDLLRATSLDELPQLMNVLTGDMSLVGPRPLPIAYLPLFSEEQKLRHQLKPGITGWAQVNGRNAISWKRKLDLDLHYVKHYSFWLDLKILFKTFLLLLSFKKDISLEEPPFTGQDT